MTLEQLHSAIADSQLYLWGEESCPLRYDPQLREFNHDVPIENLNGDEDPEQLEKFRRLYEQAVLALNKLDDAYHDLWGCR